MYYLISEETLRSICGAVKEATGENGVVSVEHIKDKIGEIGNNSGSVELCSVRFITNDRKHSNQMWYTDQNMESCNESFYLNSSGTDFIRMIPKNTMIFFEKSTLTPTTGNYQSMTAANLYMILGDTTFSV